MFVEELQSGLGLLYSDEFLCAFAIDGLANAVTGQAQRRRTECSRACCAAAAPCWADWGSQIRLRCRYGASKRAQRGGCAEVRGGVVLDFENQSALYYFR